jgi:hypothetical protein
MGCRALNVIRTACAGAEGTSFNSGRSGNAPSSIKGINFVDSSSPVQLPLRLRTDLDEARVVILNSSILFAIRSLIFGLLGTWLLLSLWGQFSLVRAAAKRGRPFQGFKWDFLGLIPLWALWTRPATWDSVLLYRDRLANGRLTAWKSAWAMSPNPFRGIWSPQSRKSRAINAWFPLLAAVAEGRKQPSECFLSRAYVSAALYISGLQPTDSIEFRQFMVARICGFDRIEPAEILFVSPFFRLEAAL